MPAALEDLFERFRRHGDADSLGQVFDRTAPALIRIALHLCGRRDDAEDVVQATYLRAIETAASFDVGRPVLPWLVGILGNQVRRRRRDAARRVDPGRLEEPGEFPDPQLSAVRRELGDAIATTIDELPARYRAVLRLHLLDGQGPSEIAAALDRRPGTVRSQLARGLRALRKLLPAGFGAAAHAQALAALPGMRAGLLARAGAAPATATSGAVALGGLTMKKIVLCAAIAALLLTWSGWLVFAELPDAAGSGGVSFAPERRAGEVAVSGPLPDARTPLDGRSSVVGDAAPEAAADGTGTLSVRVIRRTTGAPLAGVPVFVEPDRRGYHGFSRWRATTDAAGVARLPDLPVGVVRIVSGRTEYGPIPTAAIAAGRVTTHELTVSGVTVRGVVVDAAGRPVAGARIVVKANDTRELATAGPDGAFVLPAMGTEVRIGARACGFAPSVLHAVPACDDRGPLRIVLPGAGGSLRCTVVDPNGRPLPHAIVTLGDGPFESRSGKAQCWREWTDEHGVARFDGIGIGVQDAFAWARGRAPWRGTVTVAAAGEAELTIPLEPGAVIEGRVRNTAGQPLVGYEVALGRAKSAAFERFGAFAFRFTRTDEQGAYRIDGLPPGEVRVSLSPGDVEAVFTAVAGETLVWDPIVATRGAVRGLVLGPDGRGLAKAIIEASSRAPDRKTWSGYVVTDDRGWFRLNDVAPGERVRLTVRLMYFELTEFDDALPMTGEVVLRVGADALPSVRVRARIVDGAGQPIPRAEVWLLRRGVGSAPGFHTDDGGRVDEGPVPPGDYRLSVRAAGKAHVFTEYLAARRGETVDFGAVRVETGCTVAVRLEAASELPKAELYFPVVRAGGQQVGHVEIRDGRGSLSHLAAGRYTVQVRGGGFALADHPFEVAAGERRELTLKVEPGIPVTFRLGGVDQPGKRVVTVRLETAAGAVLLTTRSSVGAKGRLYVGRIALRPGEYRVRVEEAGVVVGELPFMVDPAAESHAVEVPARGA